MESKKTALIEVEIKEEEKPPGFALSPKLQSFYSQNGYPRLLKELQVEVVHDIDRCYQLWQEFSPKKTLFDTWEFRFAFWKGYRFLPHFFLIKNKEENLALLPLWYEDCRKKKKYFWFGSWWQEENHFLAKDPVLAPLLLAICPRPAHLNAISAKSFLWAKQFISLKPDDPKYVLDLRKIKKLDDFLFRLKKKRRYNLRRDKRIIEAQKPSIIFDRFTDFETMVALCKERFARKGEDTDWDDDPGRLETFRWVIKLGKSGRSYKVRMVTVKIGSRIAGVDLIALYKGCYYPLKCGYDIRRFPGLGNFVNLLEIEDALKLGMKKIDFLEINYGWKDKWFDEVPLFKYDKP